MIRLQITGRGFEIDDKISEYITKKIGSLDRFLPMGTKEVATGEVVLEIDASGREGNQYCCDALITVPGSTLQSREATINMYAAIDIVEAKLKAQAQKYKARIKPQSRKRQFVAKVLGREQMAEDYATE